MKAAFHLAAVAAAALLPASAASADVTARYVDSKGAGVMTVEANDKDDTRIKQEGKEALLTLGGVSYVIDSDASGTYAVRQDDWVAVRLQGLGKLLSGAALKPKDQPAAELVSAGTESVGGRTGTVWTLRMPTKAEREKLEVVIATDPDIAPVGRAIAGEFGLSAQMMAQLVGSVPDFMVKMNAALSKGTAIRIAKALRLDSVSHAPVSASEFALPAVVLTKEQFAARVKPKG